METTERSPKNLFNNIPTNVKIKTTPLGVKIIAILFYIATIFLFYYGGKLLYFLFTYGLLEEGQSALGFITFPFTILIIIGVIILIIQCVRLCFRVGGGLWKKQQWARIVAMISPNVILVFLLGSCPEDFNPLRQF